MHATDEEEEAILKAGCVTYELRANVESVKDKIAHNKAKYVDPTVKVLGGC